MCNGYFRSAKLIHFIYITNSYLFFLNKKSQSLPFNIKSGYLNNRYPLIYNKAMNYAY